MSVRTQIRKSYFTITIIVMDFVGRKNNYVHLFKTLIEIIYQTLINNHSLSINKFGMKFGQSKYLLRNKFHGEAQSSDQSYFN